MAPRSLLSLNQDVLSEILAHVLLDSPCEPSRAAVLRTCSSLHLLGLPHLCSVIDLTGIKTRELLRRYWKALFGVGGLFAEEGGRGRWVKKLRLGGARHPRSTTETADFPLPTLHLPACSFLHIDLRHFSATPDPVLPRIISQLDVKRFLISHSPDCTLLCMTYGRPLDFLLALQPQFWPSLESITFETSLCYDQIPVAGQSSFRRLSFSLWSFRTLVFRRRQATAGASWRDEDEIDFIKLPTGPDPRIDESTYLKNTHKIILEVYPELEQKLRKAVQERGGRDGLTALQRRMAGMMVFVDEDGTERQLLEQVE